MPPNDKQANKAWTLVQKSNRTYLPNALSDAEGQAIQWHSPEAEASSQVFCISAFGRLRSLPDGVQVLNQLFASTLRAIPPATHWDLTFDYVILSQTLQQTVRPLQVLKEMLRVGRRAIVAFPNFGHWRVRWSHLVSGRSPRTPIFPYDWYNSPNIHFFTIDDFEDLVRGQHWTVDKRIFLRGQQKADFVPNLRAELAVYLFHQ